MGQRLLILMFCLEIFTATAHADAMLFESVGEVGSSISQATSVLNRDIIKQSAKSIRDQYPEVYDLVEQDTRIDWNLGLGGGSNREASIQRQREVIAKLNALTDRDPGARYAREVLRRGRIDIFGTYPAGPSHSGEDGGNSLASEMSNKAPGNTEVKALNAEKAALENASKQLDAEGTTPQKAAEILDRAQAKVKQPTSRTFLKTARERLTVRSGATPASWATALESAGTKLKSSGKAGALLFIDMAKSMAEDSAFQSLMKGECPSAAFGLAIFPQDTLTGFLAIDGEHQDAVLKDCDRLGIKDKLLNAVKKEHKQGQYRLTKKSDKKISCTNSGGIATITSANDQGQDLKYVYDKGTLKYIEVKRSGGAEGYLRFNLDGSSNTRVQYNTLKNDTRDPEQRLKPDAGIGGVSETLVNFYQRVQCKASGCDPFDATVQNKVAQYDSQDFGGGTTGAKKPFGNFDGNFLTSAASTMNYAVIAARGYDYPANEILPPETMCTSLGGQVPDGGMGSTSGTSVSSPAGQPSGSSRINQ